MTNFIKSKFFNQKGAAFYLAFSAPQLAMGRLIILASPRLIMAMNLRLASPLAFGDEASAFYNTVSMRTSSYSLGKCIMLLTYNQYMNEVEALEI